MDISKKLPTKIPIFPLSNFIVFPETTVPLNIFENRYLQMIDDSMSTNRIIGMIQPKNNLKNPELFDVGCACKINIFNETDDGRYLKIVKGLGRFKKKKEITNEKLYRELIVEYEPFRNDENIENESIEFSNLKKILDELKLLFEKKTLPAWHPLLTGQKETTHGSGVSVRGSTISEKSVNEDDWENYIITDPK